MINLDEWYLNMRQKVNLKYFLPPETRDGIRREIPEGLFNLRLSPSEDVITTRREALDHRWFRNGTVLSWFRKMKFVEERAVVLCLK